MKATGVVPAQPVRAPPAPDTPAPELPGMLPERGGGGGGSSRRHQAPQVDAADGDAAAGDAAAGRRASTPDTPTPPATPPLAEPPALSLKVPATEGSGSEAASCEGGGAAAAAPDRPGSVSGGSLPAVSSCAASEQRKVSSNCVASLRGSGYLSNGNQAPSARSSTLAIVRLSHVIRSSLGAAEPQEDTLQPDMVGVEFMTRAAHSADYASCCADLSGVYPSPEDSGREDLVGTGRTVSYPSHHPLVVRVGRFLDVSGLVSFVYVLGCFAVEPACVKPHEGSAGAWLQSRSLLLGGVLAVVSVLNALSYAVLSVAGIYLFGRVDPQKEEELSKLDEVLASHLRSWGFWLDAASMLGTVAEMAHLWEAPQGGVPTPLQWVMLLQLGKAWRVSIKDAPRDVQEDGRLFLKGVVWIFFKLFFLAHFMACALLAVGNQEIANGDESWTEYLEGSSCVVTYTEAVYFTVLSMTSVGYGDQMISTFEKALNSLFLLLAQLFIAKVCADLTWLTSTRNYWEAHNQAKQAQTWTALRKMAVPPVLGKRVMAYQRYMARVHHEGLAQQAFADLSGNLVKELRLCTYRKLVLRAPFLRSQSKEVIAIIVAALKDYVYLPADFIVCAGDKGRELFFMFRGQAGVFVGPAPPVLGQSKEVATYAAGNYFGELGVLTGKPRAAWIIARTYAVCSVLLPSAIEELGQKCPGAFTILVQSMVKAYKLKPSMSLEEVSALLDERFSSTEEAFDWFCKCGEDQCEDEMGSRAFDEALRRLKVPELDRKIFWAEMDSENHGSVTQAQFSANFTVRELRVSVMPARKETKDARQTATGSSAAPQRASQQRDSGRDSKREDDVSSWLASLRSHPPSPSNGARAPGEPGALQAGSSGTVAELLEQVLRELAKSREQGDRLQEQIREAKQAWLAAAAVDGPSRQPPPGG